VFSWAALPYLIQFFSLTFSSLSSGFLDAQFLRNTLLVAGTHYAWNTGGLHAYESAFLFHKVESIRAVNTWIAHPDPKTAAECILHVSTLCVVEVRIIAGPSKLRQGVVVLMAQRRPLSGTSTPQISTLTAF
jgi:hypothetical protein